MAQINAVFKRL